MKKKVSQMQIREKTSLWLIMNMMFMTQIFDWYIELF